MLILSVPGIRQTVIILGEPQCVELVARTTKAWGELVEDAGRSVQTVHIGL
jgi:hypothetical protein